MLKITNREFDSRAIKIKKNENGEAFLLVSEVNTQTLNTGETIRVRTTTEMSVEDYVKLLIADGDDMVEILCLMREAEQDYYRKY